MQFFLNQRTHPFYEHSKAASFVVEDDEKVIGRITFLDNQRFKKIRRGKHWFFCYYESVNDIQVSYLLFEASFNWTRKRGLDKIIGPKGLAQGE